MCRPLSHVSVSAICVTLVPKSRGRVRRRSELLIAGDQERRQRVGKLRVRRNAGQAEAADAEPASSAARAADRPPGVADAQLVEQAVRERALIARRERPRPSCPADPSVPVVTPLPSGSGVTGMKFRETRQPAEHLIAVAREPMIDAAR